MARNFLQDSWHQLRYFHRSSGLRGIAAEVLRKFVSAIYRRDAGHLIMYRVDPHGADSRAVDDTLPLRIRHVVVRSEAALLPFESELSPEIKYSVSQLRAALRTGSVLFLMRRPRENGAGHEVLGYSLHERGVVVLFGRRYPVSPDILFLHYTEVLPAYRGLRIAFHIAEVVAAYSRAAGMSRWCSWIGTTNLAALKARERIGWTVVGRIRQVRLLGGLLTLQTSWQEVEDSLGR